MDYLCRAFVERLRRQYPIEPLPFPIRLMVAHVWRAEVEVRATQGERRAPRAPH